MLAIRSHLPCFSSNLIYLPKLSVFHVRSIHQCCLFGNTDSLPLFDNTVGVNTLSIPFLILPQKVEQKYRSGNSADNEVDHDKTASQGYWIHKQLIGRVGQIGVKAG